LGLAIANGMVALAGAMFAQQQRFFDASMGVGTAVIGLASVIIGTSLFGQVGIFGFSISVILGSILYKGCVALAIRFGLQSGDLKLVTAVLFLVILVISRQLELRQAKRVRKELR
jgi:putative ABC transport system permease protein